MGDDREDAANDEADAHAQAGARSAVDPLIGRVIEGRFEILSQLARGGMGNIYKAKQLQLGRVCALKVLTATYEGDVDPQFQKRFFLEASIAAKLTHPNTVRIFDYGRTDDDVYFIAMEYIEGRSLFKVLREEGPLDESRVSHIAQQICRSLREAHELGVVHRDLKPGNIILIDRVDESDTVKVLDFGLVKDVSGERSQMTQAGLRMGSPKYMAPEQAMGEVISPRTDVYSLGVLLFEMLCGRVPFDKRRAALTAIAHVNDPVPPMTAFRTDLDVSPSMESIVYRCLLKDPARRFQSMQDLLDALKVSSVAVGGLPPLSMRPSLVEMQAMSTRAVVTPIAPTEARPTPRYEPSEPSPASAPRPSRAPTVPQAVKRAWPLRAVLAYAAVAVVVFGLAFAARQRVSGDANDDAVAAPSRGAPGEAVVLAPRASAAPIVARHVMHVESDPPGAAVMRGDEQVCARTPCTVDAAGGSAVSLRLELPGFAPATIEVGPSELDVRAKLAAETAPAPTNGAKRPATATSATGAVPYRPSPY